MSKARYKVKPDATLVEHYDCLQEAIQFAKDYSGKYQDSSATVFLRYYEAPLVTIVNGCKAEFHPWEVEDAIVTQEKMWQSRIRTTPDTALITCAGFETLEREAAMVRVMIEYEVKIATVKARRILGHDR